MRKGDVTDIAESNGQALTEVPVDVEDVLAALERQYMEQLRQANRKIAMLECALAAESNRHSQMASMASAEDLGIPPIPDDGPLR